MANKVRTVREKLRGQYDELIEWIEQYNNYETTLQQGAAKFGVSITTIRIWIEQLRSEGHEIR